MAHLSSSLNTGKHPVLSGRRLAALLRVLAAPTCGRRVGSPCPQQDHMQPTTASDETRFTAHHDSPNASFPPSRSTLCQVKDPSVPALEKQQSSPPLCLLFCTRRWPQQVAWPGNAVRRPEELLYTHIYLDSCNSTSNGIAESRSDLYSWKLACFFQLQRPVYSGDCLRLQTLLPVDSLITTVIATLTH